MFRKTRQRGELFYGLRDCSSSVTRGSFPRHETVRAGDDVFYIRNVEGKRREKRRDRREDSRAARRRWKRAVSLASDESVAGLKIARPAYKQKRAGQVRKHLERRVPLAPFIN